MDKLSSLQYRGLLDYLLENCQHFSVCSFRVHKKDLNESYYRFFEDYADYQCDSNNFTLAQHYEKGQKFHVYVLNKTTKSIIRNMGDFFSWKLPDYPEDLSFYKDKKVVFSTISHENMVIINSMSREMAEIVNDFGIQIRPLD